MIYVISDPVLDLYTTCSVHVRWTLCKCTFRAASEEGKPLTIIIDTMYIVLKGDYAYSQFLPCIQAAGAETRQRMLQCLFLVSKYLESFQLCY